MESNTVTCSFTMDKDIYNAYRNIVSNAGESVKENIIQYMKSVIRYETPNAETLEAIKEVEELKKDPTKKTYGSFAELLEDLGI